MRWVITIAGILMLIGVILTLYFYLNPEEDNVIQINLDDELTTEKVAFESLSMIPSETNEYVMKVKSQKEGLTALKIAFEEVGDGKLKNFVFVIIEFNGEELCNAPMSEMFDGKTVEFESKLYKNKPIEITVKYYMPDTVGNEAQGTEATFDLVLSADNR